jgi:hypothetical protein
LKRKGYKAQPLRRIYYGWPDKFYWWRFCYITDFCYVGSGQMAELAKDLDFDFDAGVFQNLFGTYPIEQAIEMFQVWESNFVYSAMVSKVFNIQKIAD